MTEELQTAIIKLTGKYLLTASAVIGVLLLIGLSQQ